MNIISVRNHPDTLQMFVDYFAKCWATQDTAPIYQDCIENCLHADFALPQWYLLIDKAGVILGGAGLVTNDFISRMDLLPWLCALHVEPSYRSRGYGALLIEHVCDEAHKHGFAKIYLSTGHIDYYEKYGFAHIGDGFHPWGARSRIYERDLFRR